MSEYCIQTIWSYNKNEALDLERINSITTIMKTNNQQAWLSLTHWTVELFNWIYICKLSCNVKEHLCHKNTRSIIITLNFEVIKLLYFPIIKATGFYVNTLTLWTFRQIDEENSTLPKLKTLVKGIIITAWQVINLVVFQGKCNLTCPNVKFTCAGQ